MQNFRVLILKEWFILRHTFQVKTTIKNTHEYKIRIISMKFCASNVSGKFLFSSFFIFHLVLFWRISVILESYFRYYRSVQVQFDTSRSRHPEVFLEKAVPKICSKFTGEHPGRSVISIKLLCNFIEIVLWQGCSFVNLPHIFSTPFIKNISGWLQSKIYRNMK